MVSFKPATVSDSLNLIKLLDMENTPDIMNEDFQEGGTNLYRQDDFSAIAYFYNQIVIYLKFSK